MPPKQKQKQKQSQNVRVVVNLAEKKKPRKKRGKYRRMKEPSADVSRLAAQQAPRVQVVRYEYPVSGQPQAPPIQVVREPHATPAAVGMNQNAFGTRDTGSPMPDSSARAPVDTPSELEGAARAELDSTERKKSPAKKATALEMAVREGYPATKEGIAQRTADNLKRKTDIVLKRGALGPVVAAVAVESPLRIQAPFYAGGSISARPSPSEPDRVGLMLQQQEEGMAKAAGMRRA